MEIIRKGLAPHWPLWFALGISLWLAFANRFVQDDGLIYFRYARNFAEGLGLVWNPGELVDGYLNLLWILLLGAGLKAGIGLIEFSYLCGLFFFGMTILYTYRSVLLVSQNAWFNFLLLLLLGSNFSFVTCATGGIETHMQLCVLMACTFYFMRMVLRGHYTLPGVLRLSCLLGLAFIIRMDSAVLVACILPATAWFIAGACSAKQRTKLIVALALPSACMALGFLVFRTWYFGNLLPNIYYAKAGIPTVMSRGINYIYSFYHNYMLEALLATCLAACVLPWRTRHFHKAITGCILTLGLFIVLWNAYVIKVNGDYMEFRLIVTALPFLVLVFCCCSTILFRHTYFPAALLLLLCLNNFKILYLNHWSTEAQRNQRLAALHYQIPAGVESVKSLKGNLWHEQKNWVGIGKALGKAFDYSQDIKIAVMPAGAIPFYSRLPTLDMLGLNDRWVARNGIHLSSIPGHSRMAPAEYILASNVNLVVAQPKLVENNKTKEIIANLSAERFEIPAIMLPPDASFLCIPVDKHWSVIVLYLIRHPVIDRAIEIKQIRVFEINRNAPADQAGKTFWFQS